MYIALNKNNPVFIPVSSLHALKIMGNVGNYTDVVFFGVVVFVTSPTEHVWKSFTPKCDK